MRRVGFRRGLSEVGCGYSLCSIETTIEADGKTTTERRCYISSRALSARDFAEAARCHWAIENGLHWVLDVLFKEDQSRLRAGHGAQNMARIGHFALNLIRAMPDKRSLKAKRKLATWDTNYLAEALSLPAR